MTSLPSPFCPMTPSHLAPFESALARIRSVFEFYQRFPSVLIHSMELEDCTREAARAAVDARMPFAALCAEFGRVAADTLPHERLAGIAAARAMTRWAATIYAPTQVVDAAAS